MNVVARTPNAREQSDDRGLLLEVVDVDMQRPGKEQVAEHALHQRLVEVDRSDERVGQGEHARPRYDPINQQQGDRVQHGQQHQAHRRRQLEQFVVDEREGRCEGHEDADDIEEAHGDLYTILRPWKYRWNTFGPSADTSNAGVLRAGLVKRSEDWRWGSLWRSLVAETRTRAEATIAVADSASAKLGRANDPLSQPELDAVRRYAQLASWEAGYLRSHSTVRTDPLPPLKKPLLKRLGFFPDAELGKASEVDLCSV